MTAGNTIRVALSQSNLDPRPGLSLSKRKHLETASQPLYHQGTILTAFARMKPGTVIRRPRPGA
jgi:hypothetical protein